MSIRNTVAILAVFLCIFLIGACTASPPPDTQADLEEEEYVTYQEEPDVIDDYPEEPEEPEEELEDDEPEEEISEPPAQEDDAANEAQQEQQPAQAPAEQQPAAPQASPEAQQQEPVAQQEPAQTQEQPAPQQQPAPNQAETDANVAGTDMEMEVIRLVNAERQSAGLPPLTANSLLMRAARIRAEELDRLFSHNRPNGSSWQTVLSEVGYPRATIGENIAAGQISPAAVMSSWMGSQGHRNNILGRAYTEIGVGAALGSDGRWHWVQLFGGSGAGTGGDTASGPQGQTPSQEGGVTWVPSLAQYSISSPTSGHLVPGDVLTLTVATSDLSIPFSIAWSAPQNNSWWSFRDGVIEIFDLGPGTPPLHVSVTVFEFGNPVTELTASLNFGSR